jgi:hypothetical protein
MGFHPATGAVYATATFSDASGTYAAVVRVDVDAPGDAVEVGRIDVGRVVGFGAESVGGPLRIFARNAVLGGLYDVDTGTGAATLVLEVPESTEVDYSELRQLAFSSDGPRLLGRRAVSEEESYENRCREAARRFGYPDAATAPVTPATGPSGPTFGFEAPTTELRSSLSSGPEILASVSYGGGPGELIVASDNPDAFVCVLTFEAEMTLRFAATARFASGFLHSYRENVQAVVDPGFTPPAVPNFTIHVTRATPDADLSGRVDPDPSFLAHPELFRMFTHAAWESRKLDEIESNDPIPRDVLIRVDGSGALHIVAPLPSPVIALSGT